MSELVKVKVFAHPTDRELSRYLVECNQCGPLDIVSDVESDRYCIDHLASHGVDVSAYEAE